MNLSAKQQEFIHDNCHVSDAYNYNVEPAELTISDLMGKPEVSQQEVAVLIGQKDEIAVLGKELKSFDSKNVVLELARNWYSSQVGEFYHIKKALKNAIKIEKSRIELSSAVTKLINA